MRSRDMLIKVLSLLSMHWVPEECVAVVVWFQGATKRVRFKAGCVGTCRLLDNPGLYRVASICQARVRCRREWTPPSAVDCFECLSRRECE